MLKLQIAPFYLQDRLSSRVQVTEFIRYNLRQYRWRSP